MQIKNRLFIVTGGASGLGEGCARALLEAGAKVLVADVQSSAGQALSAELGGEGLRFLHCDVTQAADAQAAVNLAVAWALESGISLGGLVNCAGIAPAAKTLGKAGPHELELFARVVNINLIGSFNMIRLTAQALAAQAPDPQTKERGVLISTASIAAFEGQIGQAAYAASKGGVVGMTLPIARDLASLGIRHVTIAPGLFATPMLFGMPQAVQDALAASVPFPSRLGTPKDYARLALHIIENDMLNGEVIRLDGAVRLAPR